MLYQSPIRATGATQLVYLVCLVCFVTSFIGPNEPDRPDRLDRPVSSRSAIQLGRKRLIRKLPSDLSESVE